MKTIKYNGGKTVEVAGQLVEPGQTIKVTDEVGDSLIAQGLSAAETNPDGVVTWEAAQAPVSTETAAEKRERLKAEKNQDPATGSDESATAEEGALS